jgi:hypothetical protein
MRSTVVAIGLALCFATAMATPDAATWRRQTLLGESADYFFRFVTIREYPASHYSYEQSMRLEKVRKSDLRIVEHFPLRKVAYWQDLKTDLWSEEPETLPAFDLSGYLQRNAVHLAFSDDLFENRKFAVDSSGVWEVFEDGRIHLAGASDLQRQTPNLGREARVAGIEKTDFKPKAGSPAYYYLRIWSNGTAVDEGWSEDLLFVDQKVLH